MSTCGDIVSVTRKTKLLEKLLSVPADFTWAEAITLMKGLGYEVIKGDGSRRKFWNPETKKCVFIHEPHPQSILKKYAVREDKYNMYLSFMHKHYKIYNEKGIRIDGHGKPLSNDEIRRVDRVLDRK